MPSYNLTKSDLIEAASEIMETSTNNIRCRVRYCKRGESIKERTDRLCFLPSVVNPYATLEATDKGYNIKQHYTFARYYMNGEAISLPDNSSFFFTRCDSASEGFVYLEFTKF